MDNKTSDIRGDGHGAKHIWKRGKTKIASCRIGSHGQLCVENVKEAEKQTEYSCRVCLVAFRHFYGLQPDIFQAMKDSKVPEECLVKKSDLCM